MGLFVLSFNIIVPQYALILYSSPAPIVVTLLCLILFTPATPKDLQFNL